MLSDIKPESYITESPELRKHIHCSWQRNYNRPNEDDFNGRVVPTSLKENVSVRCSQSCFRTQNSSKFMKVHLGPVWPNASICQCLSTYLYLSNLSIHHPDLLSVFCPSVSIYKHLSIWRLAACVAMIFENFFSLSVSLRPHISRHTTLHFLFRQLRLHAHCSAAGLAAPVLYSNPPPTHTLSPNALWLCNCSGC